MRFPWYASSGIPEVWIVNLAAAEVEVYWSPLGDSYTSVGARRSFGHTGDRGDAGCARSGGQGIRV